MPRWIRPSLAGALVTLALSLFFAVPGFAEVQFVAPGVAGSLTGVVVGTQTYTVTFANDVTHIGWASQLDFSSSADAEAAVSAVAAELNAAGATALRFDTPSGGTFDFDNGAVWYDTTETSILGETLIRVGSNWTLAAPGPGGATAPLNNNFPFALDFELEAPPVPMLPPVGLVLLVLALVGLSLRWLLQGSGGGVGPRSA